MLYKTCFKKVELYCQWSCDYKYVLDREGADDDYDYESKFTITQCYFYDEKYNKKYYYVLTVEKERSVLFTKSEFWDMIVE